VSNDTKTPGERADEWTFDVIVPITALVNTLNARSVTQRSRTAAALEMILKAARKIALDHRGDLRRGDVDA
jgi:hypothetical protein